MRKKFAAGFLTACLLLELLLGLGGCGGYKRYSASWSDLFDTATTMVFYARGETEANKYSTIVYDRMKELDQLYDIYHAYDGLNNLYTVNQNAGIAPVQVSRDLIDLIQIAVAGYALTGGETNIALGPVLSIWHDYRTAGLDDPENAKLPPMADLRAADKLTDIRDVVIDAQNSTVFLTKAGMSLDVGSVGKPYAAELAIKDAVSAGLCSALLSAGGSTTIAVGKPLDGVRDRWGVGIQDPDLTVDGNNNIIDTIYFADNTLSCSGGYVRFYTVDGVPYSHIIDPAILMPPTLYKQVAVICNDATQANILSTALFILPYEQGLALIQTAGADACWIFADGHTEMTDGYRAISKTYGGYSAAG
ncbi:MAG: FAD:protein FMN transferase [Firmicutes bacterium]|nr:FAD:protein FMN transferase [Bacillota bacterium]